MNYDLTIMVLQLILMATLATLAFARIRTVEQRANVFFTRIGDDPSPFGRVIDAITSDIAQKIRMGLMGKASGDSRLEAAVNEDMVGDLLSGNNPAMGLLLDNYFPSWKKRLAKNPAALPYVMDMAGKFLGPSGDKGPEGKSTYAEMLKKYK